MAYTTVDEAVPDAAKAREPVPADDRGGKRYRPPETRRSAPQRGAAMDRPLTSMEYDDDEVLDRLQAMHGISDPRVPAYPPHLEFMIQIADLDQLVDGAEGVEPGHSMRFAALGEVSSCVIEEDECRIELRLDHMAGPDGKFQKMGMPPTIALCMPECEKMDLDHHCRVGDLLHLIGEAEVQRTNEHEYGHMAHFQITALEVEDESEESRG
jgi:hypothetical protein